MTRLPTTLAVQHLTDSLRALGEAPKKGQLRRIVDLETRLLRAVERDLAGLPIPDGYPVGPSNGHGGPTIVVEDENGQPDVVDVTSVEAAAIARAEHGRICDRHHELTVRAVRAVDDAVTGVQIAFAALASIDDLLKTGPPVPKTCDHCTGKRGQGGDRPIYVRGTVGDRLERALALCEACYDFVRKASKTGGSRNGYLPSDPQITHHESTGSWRIPVIERR